jgi:hypothetical protein
MDSISAAFIAVLNADIGEPVEDTYNVLKGALHRKFGRDSYIAGAVKLLESKPGFISRQVMLKEAVRITKAQKDSQLNLLAEALLTKLQTTPKGQAALDKLYITSENVDEIEDRTHIFDEKYL